MYNYLYISSEYQQFNRNQFLKLKKVGTSAKNTPVNAPNALATRSLQNPILILPQQKNLQPNGQSDTPTFYKG